MNTDFDIGNLVYILLMIVFILAGAFGKKKKQQQRVQPESEPLISESPENLFEIKLKELFNENINPDPADTITEEIPEENHIEEKPAVLHPEEGIRNFENTSLYGQITDKYSDSIEYQGETLDSFAFEEGIPNWNYAEEDYITDEIKLSEGKDLVPVDYNEELEEIMAGFDIRQGIIYSEILNRKEY